MKYAYKYFNDLKNKHLLMFLNTQISLVTLDDLAPVSI